MLSIPVANNQRTQAVDVDSLARAARIVAVAHGYRAGEISIAVVDDAAMHELNRRYLDHDYPTDVLSFLLEESADSLEGEIIVSADYAAREAPKYGWSTAEELTLYVVHGALHLVGYDDQSPEAKAAMQAKETEFLKQLGIGRKA